MKTMDKVMRISQAKPAERYSITDNLMRPMKIARRPISTN
jgi:hypothetical protein